VNNLELKFEDQEIEQFVRLISAVWQRIQNLDFPDISKYPPTMAGIKAFEKDLLV
jgi:hypothetical protein